jgi:hypothetical protein
MPIDATPAAWESEPKSLDDEIGQVTYANSLSCQWSFTLAMSTL